MYVGGVLLIGALLYEMLQSGKRENGWLFPGEHPPSCTINVVKLRLIQVGEKLRDICMYNT